MPDDEYPCRREDVDTHLMPDGTCLLFDPVVNESFVLNAAGALTWEYCDGNLRYDEIAGEIAALLPGYPAAASATIQLLGRFIERGLVFDASRVEVCP